MTGDLPPEEARLRTAMDIHRAKLIEVMDWMITDQKFATKIINDWEHDWQILKEKVVDRLNEIKNRNKKTEALYEWAAYSNEVEYDLEKHKETLESWKFKSKIIILMCLLLIFLGVIVDNVNKQHIT